MTEPAADIPLTEQCVLAHDKPTKRHVGLLCARHYHWLNNSLDQMVELYALLPYALLPGKSGDEERHGTSVEAPAPGNLNVIALTERTQRGGERSMRAVGDELWYELPDIPPLVPMLESWCLLVIEERWHGSPTAPHLNGTLTGACNILRGQRHWLAEQPWIDDYTQTIAALHRALASAAGDTMWPKPIGKCPNCRASLYNTIGLDEVTCRKCGSAWTGVALMRLRLILEQEEAKRGQETVEHEPPPAPDVRVDDAGDESRHRGDAAPTPGPGEQARRTRRVRRLDPTGPVRR
jgi:hypothetical protein